MANSGYKTIIQSVIGLLCSSGLVSCEIDNEGVDFKSVEAVSSALNAVEIECPDQISCVGQVVELRNQARYSGLASVDQSGNGLRNQWVDFDGDGQSETAFIELLNADSSINFIRDSISAGEPRTAVILSKRVGATRDGDTLQGGEFIDLEAFTAPEWHKAGNRLLRFEGPAWETDLVGYRLYLDERNGTDIFGKTKAQSVMHLAGYDGDNYHELSDWGADVLKVGDSLGVGALGVITASGAKRVFAQAGISIEILDNGPLFSRFRVHSKGWLIADETVNIQTDYAVKAGSRLTHVSMKSDKPVVGLATGIVRHDKGKLLTSEGQGEWSYIATFGDQSVFDDALGMAVFYRTDDADIVVDDPLNHAVKFNAAAKSIDYYFSAVWEKDPAEIKTKEKYLTYLNKELMILNENFFKK